jgi:alkanesulfonate monooxygenase SsuD/methylene tetrahydromethanopterin reductase-like flavin-dependent oxidoreductase (luciferase family)
VPEHEIMGDHSLGRNLLQWQGGFMDIGIGLPATIPWTNAPLILEWAKRADSGPFSSLGILDRLVYPNYEPLITLAAAAAVTERVRLMSTVLIAPLRRAGVLAKQAATIDALSGGRLSLGVGVGAREDDFQYAPASFHDRGRNLDEQLEIMKRVWSGQPVSEEVGTVGPLPAQAGGPELLIGGYTPVSIRRVGRWGDGIISGGVRDAEQVRQLFDLAEESWRDEGREGKPRLVASLYYALGPNAARGGDYIRHYYSYFGPGADDMARSIPSSPETIEGLIQGFGDVGADEVVCWPTVAELDQVDRLAEIIS